MSSVAVALTALGSLFTLVAIFGVAYVYFRGSADKATIESQGRLIKSIQDENTNLGHRVELLERENDLLKKAVAEVKGISQLRRETAAMHADIQALVTRLL